MQISKQHGITVVDFKGNLILTKQPNKMNNITNDVAFMNPKFIHCYGTFKQKVLATVAVLIFIWKGAK